MVRGQNEYYGNYSIIIITWRYIIMSRKWVSFRVFFYI